MAGRPKKADATTENEIAFGVTGYGVTIEHEGQTVEGNFITDEDLATFNDLKAKSETSTFVDKDYLHQLENISKEHGEQIATGVWLSKEDYSKMFDAQTELITAKSSGQLLTNDESAHYSTLKQKEQLEAEKAANDQFAKDKADEARKQAAVNKLGPNPVSAVTSDGKQTLFTDTAWRNLAWQDEALGIKSGGWFIKAEIPDEVLKLQSNA